jgi:hypothetical protein
LPQCTKKWVVRYAEEDEQEEGKEGEGVTDLISVRRRCSEAIMSFLEVGIHRMKFCSAANMDCFFPSASSISFFALDLLPIELTCFATADTR